ncbi:Sensor protein FixL [Stieleria neptunia]|uniref:histidine kinase n=1 Tax=Stieleria neptunia TaxID=2527979 RepID=A0A518HLG6_9BACT|nr:PAS domain S-box protein [Stieleria neptunia]QDV41683.1 Sensor protein FixL [Stieleria neptunia]
MNDRSSHTPLQSPLVSTIQYPLRILLPLSLMVMVLAHTGWSLFSNRAQIISSTNREAVIVLRRTMSQLAGSLERAARRNELSTMQYSLASLGADPEVKFAVLIDESNDVIVSMRRADVGDPFLDAVPQPYRESAILDPGALARVRMSQISSTLPLGDGHSIVGIHPVALGAKADRIRPDHLGLFVVLRDISPTIQRATTAVSRQALGTLAMSCVIAIGLGLFFHFRIAKRLERLEEMTQMVGAGDLTVRTGITGDDEVAALARSLDRMVFDRDVAEQTLGLQAMILAHIHDAVISTDMEGNVETWNSAATRLFGYSAEEAVGCSVDFLCFPDHRVDWKEQVLPPNGEPSADDLQIRLRRKDASTVLVALRLSLMNADDGQPIGIIGCCNDITEQKEIEAKLSESETLVREKLSELEHLYRTTPIGLCMMDTQLRYRRINDELARINGLPVEAHLGRPLREVLPDLADSIEPLYHDVIQSGRAKRNIEVERPPADGESQSSFFLASYHPLKDDAGRVRGVSTVVKDVSERRWAEERLRSNETQLAHVSRLSTMGEMVAGIAHEINQPLYAIANYATACEHLAGKREAGWEDKIQSVMGQIAEQAVRAGEIIKRLRGFVANTESEYCPIDLNELIHDTIKLLSFEARRLGATVTLELDDALPPVMGDSIQIQQVFVNLIRNAFEAMDGQANGENRVQIRSEAFGDEVSVSVKDSGPGISAEMVDQLKEPFYTTKEQGLGMGLAISQTIVAAHEGRLRIESDASGAEFCITFPALHEIC